MNSNILTFTILFAGVLVNSHCMMDIPEGFKYVKLKSLMFKDGERYEYRHDALNEQIQVSLTAWKPGIPLPKGIWDLYLIAEEEYSHFAYRIASIEYNGTEHDWVRIQDLEWSTIAKYITAGYSIKLRPRKLDMIDWKSFLNPLAQNWTYNIFLKTRDASLEGIRENENDVENPTVEFCSEYITTVGSNKTLGAMCPINPYTEKPMEKCLNWRRIDRVGAKCDYKISNSYYYYGTEHSIDNFCAKDMWLEDCSCINRRYYKEYRDKKIIKFQPDYCWYHPCKIGMFLTEDYDKNNPCENYNECETFNINGNIYKKCNVSSIVLEELYI